MELRGVVLLVLVAGALGDGVVQETPVLAPPRDHDRALQSPKLVVYSQDLSHEPKSLHNPQPIYVQKLEDQVHDRQRRHLLKKLLEHKSYGGGYGGRYGGGGGGGYGGGNRGYGGGPGYGGGYGNCGGNYGGGGGQAVAHASATATAYGKR